MNDEYTPDDFKNANIAIRGTRGAARRCEPGTQLPWVCDGEEWDDDKGMVEDGWRPVHEHNPHATDALEEEIQDLRDRLNAVGLDIPKSAVRMLHERGVRVTAVTSDSDYTPDEEEVRDIYESRVPHSMVDPGGEFDRFLAKIKADAWDECARSAGDMASPLMDQNQYRRDEA